MIFPPLSDATSLGVLRLDESEQVLVDLVLEGRAQAVGCAWINLQRGAFDEFGREPGRGVERHGLVVVAVQDFENL